MKIKLAVRAPTSDDDAFDLGQDGSGDSSDSNTTDDDEREARTSTRHRSSGAAERRVTRGGSRGESIDPTGETPAQSDDDDEEDDEEDDAESHAAEGDAGEAGEGADTPLLEVEPVELGSDLDPINSGAATPGGTAPPPVPVAAAAVEKARSQFAPRRKETKIIKGQTFTVIDDEIQLEDDPRGEAKIAFDGNLLGGREFKLATFTSPLRQNPNKAYMLSIDAARASGFRDSLYFFRRNPLIHKLSCNQQEKDRLIELGKLSANLKSRAVTMVSARNCFKVMGASFVKGGRHVFDDYYEDKAIASGHKPGEPAWIETYDPEKDTGTLAAAKGPAPAGATSSGLNTLMGHSGKPRSHQPDLRGSGLTSSGGGLRDEYSTLIGGGPATALFGGSGLQPFGRTWDPAAKKARPAGHLSSENWMSEYAKNVAEANRALGVVRKMNLGQVQVGLGVVEREEDMWIEVEEEEEEEGSGDESEERAGRRRRAGTAASTMVVDSPAPTTTTTHNGDVTTTSAAPSPAPFPPPPPPPPPLSSLPHDFSDHRPPSSDAPSPLPTTTSTLATPDPDTPSLPKKRKLIKVYNPIRGIYDPETNTPHVYASTQPTRASTSRIDALPHIFPRHEEEEEGMKEEEEEDREGERHRTYEEAAARAGVATLEYVVDEVACGQHEALLPGLWDFRGVNEQRWEIVAAPPGSQPAD